MSKSNERCILQRYPAQLHLNDEEVRILRAHVALRGERMGDWLADAAREKMDRERGEGRVITLNRGEQGELFVAAVGEE